MQDFFTRVGTQIQNDPWVSAILALVGGAGWLVLKFIYSYFFGRSGEKAAKIMAELQSPNAKVDLINATITFGQYGVVHEGYILVDKVHIAPALGRRDSGRIYRLAGRIIKQRRKTLRKENDAAIAKKVQDAMKNI